MLESLSIQDIEQIIKLLDETTDPSHELLMPDRRRLLMRGLARIVDADLWIWSSTVANHEVPGDFMTTCVVDEGWQSPEEQLKVYEILTSPEFGGRTMHSFYRLLMEGKPCTVSHVDMLPKAEFESLMEVWRTTGFEHFLLAMYPLNRDFSSNCGLHRRRGKPDFTMREKMIVQTVYSQVEWLHRYGQNETVRETTIGLSPRERQTLLFLLAGCSHKEVAERMQISQHTVNAYTKQLHKKFGVSSRAELQAHFYLGDGDNLPTKPTRVADLDRAS